jgi:hypothetical protein
MDVSSSTDRVKWRRKTAVAGSSGRDVMGEGKERMGKSDPLQERSGFARRTSVS